MAEKPINSWLKTTLELGPVLAFFVGYIWLKNETFTLGGVEYQGFVVVTAAFVPLMLASTAILWHLTGHLSRMQVMTAVLVTVFGGLSVWFNNPSFFKMKPTVIYLLFAAILGAGLLRGQSYLRSLMDTMLPLTAEGWMILTRRMALFFVTLAVLNELIWRTQSEQTWVYFKTFGLTAAMFIFFIAQSRLFHQHAREDQPDVSKDSDV